MYRVSSFAFTQKKKRHCHLEDAMEIIPKGEVIQKIVTDYSILEEV